jgi:Fuc2NAc and GlcNAc transferase
MKIIFYCLLTFLLSTLTTYTVRLYMLRHSIFDIPNERSSHQIPTPRGGGIAIVLTFSLATLLLTFTHAININLSITLLGGGLAIAALGYCDDLYTLPARWRILVHILSAAWALYWLGGFPLFTLHWQGSLIALLGIVWCINFYNFMDGIDGLASSEGLFVAIAAGVALHVLGSPSSATILWLLSAAIAGFVLWNWPPAKIFLGDAGSGYLGYVFAAMTLYTVNQQLLPLTFWWIILAVFICDATFTLFYRIHQGQRWYSAHREHAYQHLIARGASHKQVTLGITLINCLILFPIALATLHWPTQSLFLLSAILLSFFLLWRRVKASS